MGQQAASCCEELRGAATKQSVPGSAGKLAVHAAVEDGVPMESFDVDETAPEKADWPALPPPAGLAGAAVVSAPSSVSGSLKRAHSRHSRLANGSHLEVDEDLVRAVSLATTLRSFGSAWRVNPQHMSPTELSRLWNASQQADSIDIFVSHTWSTPGHQKYASLLLSSYWHYALGGWIIAAISVGLLYTGSLLPGLFQALPGVGPGPVDAAPWIHLVSPFIALLSLVWAPYISSNCSSTTSCFLDVVCVNQSDALQQERGIYGIGGFLAVSRELRVLWSPPYLSRLWCVFEIAAFRKANPLGKLVFQPLFVERDILANWLGMYLLVSALLLFIATGARGGSSLPFFVFLGICCFGLLPAVHYVRKGYSEQEQISQSLSDFDVCELQCRSDFDKRFIHSAVMQWYGSLEEFNMFVRGPLKDEILQTMLVSRVPLHYIILCVTPAMGLQLDFLAALLAAGLPFEAWGKWLFGQLALTMLVVSELKCFFWLSKRFAKPFFSHPALDFGQTLLVVILFACCLLPPFVAVFRSSNASLMGAIFTFLAAFALLGITFSTKPCCLKTLLSKLLQCTPIEKSPSDP